MRKITILLCALMLAMPLLCQEQDTIGAEDSSGDFSEFEDFDDDFGAAETTEQEPKERKQQQVKSAKIDEDFANGYDNDDNNDDAIVEDDENEFEHFKDEEEFEGFNKNDPIEQIDQSKLGEPKITIAKVPMHFR